MIKVEQTKGQRHKEECPQCSHSLKLSLDEVACVVFATAGVNHITVLSEKNEGNGQFNGICVYWFLSLTIMKHCQDYHQKKYFVIFFK